MCNASSNDSDQKFLSPKFLNISLKQLFSTFHATLITIVSRCDPHGRFTIRRDDTGGAAHSCAAGHTTCDKITMSRKCFFFGFLEIFFQIENFRSQNLFKVFLKTTFVHVLCYSDHYELKFFFRFSKTATIQFLTSFPP